MLASHFPGLPPSLFPREEGGVEKVGFRATQLSLCGGDPPLLGIALTQGMAPSALRALRRAMVAASAPDGLC